MASRHPDRPTSSRPPAYRVIIPSPWIEFTTHASKLTPPTKLPHKHSTHQHPYTQRQNGPAMEMSKNTTGLPRPTASVTTGSADMTMSLTRLVGLEEEEEEKC